MHKKPLEQGMDRDVSVSPSPEDEARGDSAGNDMKGTLMRRKDFLETDASAKSHPNRLYYFKRNQDFDEIIEACSRKLQVISQTDFNKSCR